MRLRQRLASVGLLVCVASLVGHGQTPQVFMPRELQEPRPTFRARAEAVAIDVFVTDADGKAVNGLTADDFELDENGTRQDITTFRAVNIPVDVRDEERPLAEREVPVTPWSEKTLTAQHPLYAALPTPPTTVRQFRQADTITVFTEVYDNKGARPVRVRAQLRQPNQPAALELSQDLDVSKPRASGGHAVAFKLPLANVRPGRYILHLEAIASEDHTATREIPVSVLEP